VGRTIYHPSFRKIVRAPLETANFIQDLLTAGEIKNLSKRLRIAKLILAGNTQREISQKLHCSLATTTKVAYWLNRGGEGFKKVIARLPKRYTIPKNLPPRPLEFQLPQILVATTQHILTKRQSANLDKFAEKVEDKKILDRDLQSVFDKEFRTSRSKRKQKIFKNVQKNKRLVN